jgi:hypothetical protein
MGTANNATIIFATRIADSEADVVRARKPSIRPDAVMVTDPLG